MEAGWRAEGDVGGQAIRDFVQTEIDKNNDEMIVEDSEGFWYKGDCLDLKLWINVKKIALKLQVPLAFVRKTIKDYKTRANVEAEQAPGKQKKRVVDNNHIKN